MNEGKAVRLQKIISEAGLASRREAETWIEEGLVTINGKIAILGEKADPGKDAIKVKGKLLKKNLQTKAVHLLLNKPKGVICSHEVGPDPTIYDILPKEYAKVKLMCAGRLDKDSEGLVLLSSDGELVNKIMHPRFTVTKRYIVKVSPPFLEKHIPKLEQGIKDDGEHLYASKIIPLIVRGNALHWVEVHLDQGRKRQIRRLFERFRYYVNKLERVQIGGLKMKGVKRGRVQELSEEDIEQIFE